MNAGPDYPAVGAVLAYVRWAVKASDLPTTARAVALTAASYYNRDEGCARPSWPELGAVLELDRGTVWRNARRVTEAGIWTVERTPGRANRYRFPLSTPVAPARRVGLSTPVAPARPTRRASATPPVAPARPERSRERASEQEARCAALLGPSTCAPPPWVVLGITPREWAAAQ